MLKLSMVLAIARGGFAPPLFAETGVRRRQTGNCPPLDGTLTGTGAAKWSVERTTPSEQAERAEKFRGGDVSICVKMMRASRSACPR